jgi:hypothetical protein
MRWLSRLCIVVFVIRGEDLLQVPIASSTYWQNAIKIWFHSKVHRVDPISSLRRWITVLGTAQIKALPSLSVRWIL